jgi:predicted urease superfamily metal-dependent hydrolase
MGKMERNDNNRAAAENGVDARALVHHACPSAISRVNTLCIYAGVYSRSTLSESLPSAHTFLLHAQTFPTTHMNTFTRLYRCGV